MSRFERVRQWCEEAESGLCRTFAGELDQIRDGVNRGRFELWKIDGARSWMVTRIDGDTLTVCCYQGRRMLEDVPHIIEAARRLGLNWLGYWTEQKALGRMLARHGFRAEESDGHATVHRMSLANELKQKQQQK